MEARSRLRAQHRQRLEVPRKVWPLARLQRLLALGSVWASAKVLLLPAESSPVHPK